MGGSPTLSFPIFYTGLPAEVFNHTDETHLAKHFATEVIAYNKTMWSLLSQLDSIADLMHMLDWLPHAPHVLCNFQLGSCGQVTNSL